MGLGALSAEAADAPDSERRLALHHTHTGKDIDLVYYRDGEYDIEALGRLRAFLADFRTGEAHDLDPKLYDILFDLQARTGHDGPFEVISAYRSPGTNAQLRARSTGVAEKSQHMEGKAIDVRLRGFPTQRLHEIALGLQRGGVGLYVESDFIHVDTGRVRSW